MTLRQRTVARHPDGRRLVMLSGDELRWRFDPKQEAYMHVTNDGVIYAVRRSNPEGVDSRGHRLFRYWQARVSINGDIVNLGDEHMNAFEGKEVCQIYESARHMPREVNSKSEVKKIDDTRGAGEEQHPQSVRRIRRLLSHAGADGAGSRRR